VALLLGTWFLAAVAPCAAANFEHGPDMDMRTCGISMSSDSAMASICDTTAMVNCNLPEPQPISAGNLGSGAPTPIVFNVLPITFNLARTIGERQNARNAADVSHPPLNLKHAVLRL
jgi:hypothetical protein